VLAAKYLKRAIIPSFQKHLVKRVASGNFGLDFLSFDILGLNLIWEGTRITKPKLK